MAKSIPPEQISRMTAAHNEFLAEFGQEGDRACVILGAAKLDSLLYQMLSRALRPNPSQPDAFLEGNGPLATFSARIDAAHRLGLIASDLARALHLVRKIRNDFAHEAAGASLSAGSHRDRVMELARPFVGLKEYERHHSGFQSFTEGAPREFRAVLSVLVVRLAGTLHSQEPLSLFNETFLVPPSWTRVPDEGGT